MIKVIIGLGNPGHQYYRTRHSIGFRVLDKLADLHGASWRAKGNAEYANARINDIEVLLIKPQTFMNSSGAVVPELLRRGIKSDEILVVHDELELPFGKIAFKTGGSAKGHNGLKSIIAACGPEFHRIRVGIARPENREDVPDYVLRPFAEDDAKVDQMIDAAVKEIEHHFRIKG